MTDGVPQLTTLCRRVILRNLSAVHDLGDMPYRLARPLLQQCRPDQLRQLESASPHLAEDTQELWRHACIRDFIELRKQYEGASHVEPQDWREVYNTKQQKVEEAKAAAKAKIKGRYAEHSAQKDAKKTIVSDVDLRRGSVRPKVAKTPATPGQAMLARARSGSAIQSRRMMLIPPRSTFSKRAMNMHGFVRAAPNTQTKTRPAYDTHTSPSILRGPDTAPPPKAHVSREASMTRLSPSQPNPSSPTPSPSDRGQKRPLPEPTSSMFMPKRRIPSQLRHSHV
ncbi:hypothetical protein MPSI1_000195 [Malassezia psittaci]|uniref:Elongin-A n=1 Tax=Malassezia psittaci TaxID=1821823 RepID=A0AAF0JCS1_9BASI|nr:hypothetical protein MPSI1_000195 [Malassezia psittaci]